MAPTPQNLLALCAFERRLADGALPADALGPAERHHAERLAALGFLRWLPGPPAAVAIDARCRANPVPWRGLRDDAMLEALVLGDALDVAGSPRSNAGDYLLGTIPNTEQLRFARLDSVIALAARHARFAPFTDIVDARIEAWIVSAGVHRESGQVWASTSPRYRRNPAFVCVYNRA